MTLTPRGRLSDWIALCGALALLALVLAVGACGSDDLIFPGDIPVTSTSQPTSTATP
ncbi:hypothetical protein KF840_15145 [bacterium]|nr:hypothetical protein [bacterium]